MPRILPLLLLVFAAAIASTLHAVDWETDPKAAADPDFAAGKKAIEARNWGNAIESFGKAALRAPENADIENYLGYASRNAGKLDAAFQHYRRALKLDPKHRGAHEYIGEAYLMAGDLAGARKHLDALRKICLLPCEELGDLERAVATHIKKSAAGGSAAK